MTNSEAIEYGKEQLEIFGGRHAEFIRMAIEALSNVSNTFNTLDTLERVGITDKQISMAIGAIIHMLNIGYYSEDMEDALNAVIRVLAEVKEMFFKDRKEIADKAEQWMQENHVAKTPLSVISYLEAMGWLKLDNNSTKVDKENVDIISRQDAIDAVENCEHGEELFVIKSLLSAQPEIIRCKDCRWWDKSEDSPFGYCMAMKHGYMSANWEIGIYRRYKGDFYCADAERRSDDETNKGSSC